MSEKRHAQVKEIFLKAVALRAAERRRFLDQACGDRRSLRAEVETLLEHHRSGTILTGAAPRSDLGGAAAPPLRAAAEPSAYRSPAGRLVSRALGGPWRRLIGVLIAMAAFVLLAAWTHFQIKHSLQDVVGRHLEAMLNANVAALEAWVDRRRADAEAWAGDPSVRECVRQLVEGEGGEAAGPPSGKDATEEELLQILSPYLQEQGSATVLLVDRSGRVLTSSEEAGGDPKRVLADAFPWDEVFRGHTVFQAPQPDELGFHRTEGGDRQPITWMHAPVRGGDGAIIASLGFAALADEGFNDVLTVGRMGRTGETYAMDENALMISESRFTDDLQTMGLVPEAPGARSIAAVEVRDPGRDLTRTGRGRAGKGGGGRGSLPLTRLAAEALTHRTDPDPARRRGLLLAGYRNYRGVEVLGAWRWLPEYRFGVATEVDVREADSPLWYFEASVVVVFVALAAAAAAALLSSFAVVRLRREVGEALHLGQYTLLNRIGEGGMGTVYLARHAFLKRPTAVKVIKAGQLTRETIARFEREVQLASLLTHPNTIEIYDYGRSPDGVFYYAMEHLAGWNLAELVSREGPVPLGRVVHVLRQVCGSLREAHALGLVHRDIKPQNIMLCRRGGLYDVVKVLDFGLAKDLEGGESLALTAPGRVLGTPLYMAPERFTDPAAVDARSDIYSLGAVGYYLAAGRPVFDSSNNLDLIEQVIHDRPAPPSQRIAAAVAPELETLLLCCLEKEPDRRPGDIGEVLEMLDAAARQTSWSDQDAEAWWESRREAPPGRP